MEQKPKLPIPKDVMSIILNLEDCIQRLARAEIPFELIHLLTTPVKELDGLSEIAKNAVYKTTGKKNESNEDISLFDIIKKTKKDFLKTIRVDEARVKEIEDFLRSHGLDFKPERAE